MANYVSFKPTFVCCTNVKFKRSLHNIPSKFEHDVCDIKVYRLYTFGFKIKSIIAELEKKEYTVSTIDYECLVLFLNAYEHLDVNDLRPLIIDYYSSLRRGEVVDSDFKALKKESVRDLKACLRLYISIVVSLDPQSPEYSPSDLNWFICSNTRIRDRAAIKLFKKGKTNLI